MKDIFLADAHLFQPEDRNYQRLIAFLHEQQGQVRTLYLLGDIFKFWLGYRHVVFSPYVPILEALRQIRESGTAIVYVEGNHDYLIGPYFRETLGCTILPDGGEVVIDGRRVYLAHGDLVNPADRSYRMLRWVLRSPLARALMQVVPPDVVWGISRWGSAQSQKGHARNRERWSPEPLLISHAQPHFAAGCEVVITGHFHVPICRQDEGKTLIGLGDWIDQYSYAVCEDGVFSLLTA